MRNQTGDLEQRRSTAPFYVAEGQRGQVRGRDKASVSDTRRRGRVTETSVHGDTEKELGTLRSNAMLPAGMWLLRVVTQKIAFFSFCHSCWIERARARHDMRLPHLVLHFTRCCARSFLPLKRSRSVRAKVGVWCALTSLALSKNTPLAVSWSSVFRMIPPSCREEFWAT